MGHNTRALSILVYLERTAPCVRSARASQTVTIRTASPVDRAPHHVVQQLPAAPAAARALQSARAAIQGEQEAARCQGGSGRRIRLLSMLRPKCTRLGEAVSCASIGASAYRWQV